MEKIDKSRRKLFRQLIFWLAGSGLLSRYLLTAQEAVDDILTVPLTEIPQQGGVVYRQARVVLVWEAGEVVALSLVCTHLGCTLNVTPVGLVCPCHGSCFDRSGQVLKGPAISPLEKFKVRRYYDRLEICLRPREVA